MENKFPILAIETSGDLCSAAVLITEKDFSETNILYKHVHSEKLMTIVKNTLELINIKLDQLHHIAVSAGPGSFTGLRIGMSTAKGLAFGKSLPIVPVPTFEAMALEIVKNLKDNQKFIIANKVNTTECYYSKFRKFENFYEIVEDVRLINSNEINAMIGNNELVFGNFRGDSQNNLSSPHAEFIAKWSYFFSKDLLTFDYDYLEPNYLKKFIANVKK